MEKETFKKAKRIDTMLAVLREERQTLVLGGYQHYIISGIGQNDAETRLTGIDSELMANIIKWYDAKIQELETKFEEL